MYHPDAMLKVAHTREAELVREAERCRVPKAEPDRLRLSRSVLFLALCAVLPVALLIIRLAQS